MSRPRKLQPDYCEHKTSGRAFVRLAGKQIWLGPHGSRASKDRYLAVVSEWISRGRPASAVDAETTPPPPSAGGPATAGHPPLAARPIVGPTLTVVIEPYWDFARSYYRKDGRPTDEVGCIKAVLRLLRQLYAELPVAEFDSLKMLAVQQAMIDKGWARKTINDHLGRLKRCLKWLASRKYVPAGVYHEALTVAGLEAGRSAARETVRKIPVPADHVEAVRPFVARQVWTMIKLQLLCAARPGEVVQLRNADIDRGKRVWVFRPRRHKLEHHDLDRQIFIGPEAQAVLTPFMLRPDDAPLFSPAEAERERRDAAHAARRTPAGRGNRRGAGRLPRGRRPAGDCYTVDSYRRAIARACDRADAWAKGGQVVGDDERLIPHWHPHRLRHNAATEIRRRYGAEAAKLALGVQNMDVAEIYAERDLKVVERVMAEVG